MKYRILGALGLMLLVAATPVAALTVDEVIGLTRAGASDAVILAKIDADGAIFHLTVDDILLLKEKHVSDVVITYMINTGKAEVLENNSGTEGDSSADTDNQPAYDDEQGGQTGDYDSGGNVSFSFGYYYPHWPGYSYSYYYDPFWWPSWTYYWAYWQPYPYYYWYYDPWYASNGYYHGYYDHCYYGSNYGYGSGYHDSYADGRNVGNRGPSYGYDRVIKDPGSPSKPGTNQLQQSRQSVRLKEPRSDMVAMERTPATVRNTIRRPDGPRSGTNVIRSPQRSRLRTQPAPQYIRGVPRASQLTRSHIRTQPGQGEAVVIRSHPSESPRKDAKVSRPAPQERERNAPAPRERGDSGGGRSFDGGRGSSGPAHSGGGFRGGGGGGSNGVSRTGKH